MKLLVFHPVVAPYRLDLFNALDKAYDMRLCLMQRNLPGQTFDMERLYADLTPVPEYLTETRNILGIHIPKGIFRTIRTTRPDVVLCSEYNFPTLLTLLYRLLTFRLFKVVSIVDDSYDMASGGNGFSRKHAVARRLITPLLDEVITVEPRVNDWFRSRFGKGVCMPIITDEVKSRRRLERILPLSEQYVRRYNLAGKKVALFVGRLVDIKNPAMLVRAFRQLEDSDYRLVIVGSGDEEKKLRELSQDDSRIIMTGRLEGDALYAWYNVAQVFTLPSRLEPFGAVTNEALLGGCYSLISRNAGSACLIDEDVNGNIIDPNDMVAYTRRLDFALQNVTPVALPMGVRPDGMKIKFKDAVGRLLTTLNNLRNYE